VVNLFKDADIKCDLKYSQYRLIIKASERIKKVPFIKHKEKRIVPRIIHKSKYNEYALKGNSRAFKSTLANNTSDSIKESSECVNSPKVNKEIFEDIKFSRNFYKYLLNPNKKYKELDNSSKLLESDEYLLQTATIKPIA